MRPQEDCLQVIHKYAYEQEEEFYEKLFRARGIDRSLDSSAHSPESAVGPNVAKGIDRAEGNRKKAVVQRKSSDACKSLPFL